MPCLVGAGTHLVEDLLSIHNALGSTTYMMVHACNRNIQGVETVESEVQDHVQLLSGSEDSLSYMRLCLKKGERGGWEKKRKRREKGRREGVATALPFGSGQYILF